ncbi:MAG: DUF6931 family protein [Novosphingobium sp.]
MPPCADGAVSPKDYFDAALASGERHDLAVGYLGAVLPRLEAIQWATEALEKAPHKAGTKDRSGRRKGLFDSVQAWLRDPSDHRRRAAWALAGQEEESSAERLLACAVYFSGGSIAPEDCEPVLPDPAICGRLAAAAILTRAYENDDPEAVLRFAVAEGDRIASS